MAAKKEKHPGYGKLLDAWVAHEGAGEPFGCLVTSFTFDPVFFEEECLGRFLNLETDPREDGALYLVEREEKLSQVNCAAALVDQHHCIGGRSLRWDMLPVRLPGKLLHAKISLLAWTELIRIIVSSANLTESGYRRNQEIFGVVDYSLGSESPLSVLLETITFLEEIAILTQPAEKTPSPPLHRIMGFLEGVRKVTADWGFVGRPSLKGAVNLFPVLISPTRPDVFSQLSQLWPGSGKPERAKILSPFFDAPDVPSMPAKELWNKILRRRGEALVSFHVSGEEVSDEDAILLHAPEALKKAQPRGRHGVSTDFYQVTPQADRPLHAKTIWLEDDRWILYLIGSSNFTKAGIGLKSEASNFEANLAYVVDSRRNVKAKGSLSQSFPKGTIVKKIKWPKQLVNEDTAEGVPLLPSAFGVAIYDVDESHGSAVRLQFLDSPPAGWVLFPENCDVAFFSEDEWLSRRTPDSVTIPWTNDRPPSGFWVSWNGVTERAWWPVNVASANCLRPPDELKELPLEMLITILTSARPLHLALKSYLKKKEEGFKDWETLRAPHERVDTTQFLLQRTRRISCALTGLRERLERPATSIESLEWRLKGPIGVLALAKALHREARTGEEEAFLMAELALELTRVQPKEATGCLSPEEIKQAIHNLIPELNQFIPDGALEKVANLKSYIEVVFKQGTP